MLFKAFYQGAYAVNKPSHNVWIHAPHCEFPLIEGGHDERTMRALGDHLGAVECESVTDAISAFNARAANMLSCSQSTRGEE